MSAITAPTEVIACKYRRSLDAIQADPNFDEDDTAEVTEWLAGHRTAGVVSTQLRGAGYSVSATVIKDHRRGECACRVDS